MKKPWLWAVAVLAACGTHGTPELAVTVSPNFASGPAPLHVKAVATAADGTIGKGTVSFTSDEGDLAAASAALDAYGTATVDLTCDPAVTAACADPLQVTAKWTVDGEVVTAQTRVNSGGTGGSLGSGGGGGGAGGGTGGGAPSGFGSRISCTGMQKPNLNAHCCRSSNPIINGPPCDFFPAVDGQVYNVPYTLEDGGVTLSVPYRFTVPSPYADQAACRSLQSGFEADLSAWDGGLWPVSTTCSDGWVEADGTWSSFEGGGCSSVEQNHFQLCDVLYADGGTPPLGIWHVMSVDSSALVINGARYLPATTINGRTNGYYWVQAR